VNLDFKRLCQARNFVTQFCSCFQARTVMCQAQFTHDNICILSRDDSHLPSPHYISPSANCVDWVSVYNIHSPPQQPEDALATWMIFSFLSYDCFFLFVFLSFFLSWVTSTQFNHSVDNVGAVHPISLVGPKKLSWTVIFGGACITTKVRSCVPKSTQMWLHPHTHLHLCTYA